MKQLAAILLACLATTSFAEVDDRNLVGTFAIDCANLAKGAVIVSRRDATLIAGEKITRFDKLEDVSSEAYGKQAPPREFVGAMSLHGDRVVDDMLIVNKDKRGLLLKTNGFNETLLPAGLVFNSGQNTFRKCPIK